MELTKATSLAKESYVIPAYMAPFVTKISGEMSGKARVTKPVKHSGGDVVAGLKLHSRLETPPSSVTFP
jgi:hypothetical protein